MLQARSKKSERNPEPKKKSRVDCNTADACRSPGGHWERETMPQFDESIFNPEVAAMALGFSMDDLADITSFIRWIYDQKEKHERKGSK